MARRPRIVGVRLYHHIYAWGNNRQPIFVTDQHYRRYLGFLEIHSKDYRVDIVAYALMQSHIHLFVFDLIGKVPQFMNSLHGEYAQYYNQITGHIGHVFGERYNNKVVQANVYGLWLSRYIHRQALEAGLVADPREYQWSSYQGYLGETPIGFLKPEVILGQFGFGPERIHQYEAFILGAEHGPIDWEMRSVTVIGDESFRQDMRERETAEDHKNLTDEEVFNLLVERFNVNPDLLLAARGLTEKRMRRKIIRYLVEDAGLRPTRVAQLCNISSMAVQKALNTEV